MWQSVGGVGWCSRFTTCKQGWVGCQATHTLTDTIRGSIVETRVRKMSAVLFGVWEEICHPVAARGDVKLSDCCQGKFIILSSMSWPFWINKCHLSRQDLTPQALLPETWTEIFKVIVLFVSHTLSEHCSRGHPLLQSSIQCTNYCQDKLFWQIRRI